MSVSGGLRPNGKTVSSHCQGCLARFIAINDGLVALSKGALQSPPDSGVPFLTLKRHGGSCGIGVQALSMAS